MFESIWELFTEGMMLGVAAVIFFAGVLTTIAIITGLGLLLLEILKSFWL